MWYVCTFGNDNTTKIEKFENVNPTKIFTFENDNPTKITLVEMTTLQKSCTLKMSAPENFVFKNDNISTTTYQSVLS